MRGKLAVALAAALVLAASASAAAQAARRPMSDAARRAPMHDVLRKYREPHDTYLALSTLGTAETVPLLLERFRQDHGMARLPAPPPPPPISDPGSFPYPVIIVRLGPFVQAYDCVHGHLVDVLRNTTNTDRGMYYEDWAAWWRENQSLSQDTWVAKGFAEAGLHVADPIDDRYAVELLGAFGGETPHLRFNAERVLRRATAVDRARWRGIAALTGTPAQRLGVVRVLDRIDRADDAPALRRLSRDPDAAVARAALTALNVRLRAMVADRTPAAQIVPPRDGYSASWIVSTAAGVRMGLGSTIAAVDAAGRRLEWRRPGPSADLATAVGTRIVLGSYDGDLAAVDLDGRVRWQSPRSGRADAIRRVIPLRDDIVVVRNTRFEIWDPTTGTLRRSVEIDAWIYDAAVLDDRLFLADARGLERVDDGRLARGRPLDGAVSIGVGPAGVCITSAKAIACYDPATLETRWTTAIEPDGAYGHGAAPVSVGDLVFVLSRDALTAHRASDGRVVWASDGGQYAHGFVVTPYGVLTNNDRYRGDLLDTRTGEVRLSWREPGVSGVAVAGSSAFVRGRRGSIWRLELAHPAAPALPER